MTYAIQELVIRDVAPVDTGEITGLVAAAMWDGPVARWMVADPAVRRSESPGYFAIFVEHAVRYGEVYATADADTGDLAGVALWFPFTSLIPPPTEYEQRLKEVAGPAFDRACALDGHHARIDGAGIPAYLEANDPRNRDLYLRHGYRVRSVIDLPDGPPLWSMWRPPMT